jgi:hypothetical protein
MGHEPARVAVGAAAMLTALGFVTSAGAQASQDDAALVSRGGRHSVYGTLRVSTKMRRSGMAIEFGGRKFRQRADRDLR